jgi:hypothetical protein
MTIGDMWTEIKNPVGDITKEGGEMAAEALPHLGPEQRAALIHAERAWVKYSDGVLAIQVQGAEGKRTVFEKEVAFDALQAVLPPHLAKQVEEHRVDVDAILAVVEGKDPDTKMNVLFTALVRCAVEEGMELQDLGSSVMQRLALMDHAMQEEGDMGVEFGDLATATAYVADVRKQVAAVGDLEEAEPIKINALVHLIHGAADAARRLGPTLSAENRTVLQVTMNGLKEDFQKLRTAMAGWSDGGGDAPDPPPE